ncbi:HNH endonuclease signature motif containing protein [Clostridium sp. KNHs216]|uniref:HNH endonuclease signature motif containing protein n=1 Tax=Clostridium sp. KNHs216 TaxID=1550235 RepID=UPI0011549294|nr:HNH endonuclease signature motif containing protein [Clostridium sp. KNHs216]TQI68988.1 HNH endonuclease [Clostridium sp. KNHs216]
MKRHQYSEMEREFLRKNIANNSYTELKNKFNAEFGLNLTKAAIEHICKRTGIDHGHPGATFAKGERNPFSPTLPIGSEMVSAGKVYIKIANNLVPAGKSRIRNWVQKNRYVYEQAHEELPDGYQIIALDGNKRNFDPSNLYAVPKKINMMLCMNKWFFKNPEITLAAIKWCELFYALKE